MQKIRQNESRAPRRRLGLMLAAPVAELVGVRFWYVVGSLACIVVAGTVLLPSPLRRLEDTAPAPRGVVPTP